MFDKEMPGPVAGGTKPADQTEGPLTTKGIGRCIFQLMKVSSVCGELLGWRGMLNS